MAKMMTTSQKKNTTIPGIAYPATSLVLATAPGYPARPDLCGTIGPPNPSPDPAVGPTHPGGPMAGSVGGEAAAYAEARLAVGPLAGPRHPPPMPSPARLMR